ncbi:phytanoyl-CoA dioxygenase family protein [Actinopolymorpha sp. B11F2]|uniref:phytanoyl-CoA dioxygenase family protein n=1 Tax=Actinopolymorpha sp. B11F2 TaxID=3160862 RepID=UPI0032E3BA10
MSLQATEDHEIIQRYDETGYAIFRKVIDADLINEVHAHVDWLQARNPELRPENLGHVLMRDDPFWVRLIADDRLLDIAQMFIGPDIALFASHYICKPAYSGQPVLWHQDGAFWPLEPMQVVTLWLAADPSTPENGCVRLVPGTHKLDVAGMRDNTEVESVLGKEIAVDIDEDAAVDVILEPGDVEVHHPHIVHGSNANTSPHRRCGLTIRYIPTTTRIVTDDPPWASAFHLRGEPGVNPYQPRPRYVAGKHLPFAGCEEWS